jgi:hypothetical protein
MTLDLLPADASPSQIQWPDDDPSALALVLFAEYLVAVGIPNPPAARVFLIN